MLSLKVKIKINNNQKLIIDTLSNEHRMMYNFLLNNINEYGTDFKLIRKWYQEYRNKSFIHLPILQN